MLVFPQVPWKDKLKALKNVSDVIDDNGYFYLCDKVILFNTDEVTKLSYIYGLRGTTPDEMYKNCVELYINYSKFHAIDYMKKIVQRQRTLLNRRC